MEKGLVILLLCCAGALVAESMPTAEQRRVLELLQQELTNARASQYPVAAKQQIRNQQIEEQQIRNQQIEQQIRNQQIEEQQIRNQQIRNQQMQANQYPVAANQYPVAEKQQIRNQQIEEQQMLNAKEQKFPFPTNPVEQGIRNQQIRNQQIRNQQIRNQQILNQQIENAKEQQSANSGVVYTRWGSTECPNTSTLVYSGRAGGAHYSHPGTAADYICLPENPEYYSSSSSASFVGLVYGSEYETWDGPLDNLKDQNVPCAVCYAERNAQIMVPAKITCPSQWTREYNGYLMAAYFGHASAKNFVCLDVNAQPVRGEARSTDGAFFCNTRLGDCLGLDCPPYDTKKELACVVCTR